MCHKALNRSKEHRPDRIHTSEARRSYRGVFCWKLFKKIERLGTNKMSKSKQNLDALSKQIEALLAKRDKELARLKDVITNGLLTDELVTKLGDYSDADLKKIGKILASKVDDCIAQFEKEKADKKTPKVEPKEEPKVASVPTGTSAQQNTSEQQMNRNYGGFVQTN